jgi:opacity protein-like surface antigen
MKNILFSALALFAFSAHANAAGSMELVIYGDRAPSFGQISVNEDGGNLVGLGGSSVYLEQQRGGFKGNAFGRFFDLTCNGDVCMDNGATQAQLTVKYLSGGFTLDGQINFVSVHATVTDQEISFSANGFNTNVSFELNRGSEGTFSGDGVFGSSFDGAPNPFTATLTTSGTLEGLKDPAAFIVLIANPLTRN